MKSRCYEFMDDLESRDLTKLDKWFLPESLVWIPPCDPVEGSRRVLALFRAIFRRYNDLHWKVVEVYEVGSNRFFYVSESWGVMDNDAPYKNRILTDISFDADGKICHLSDYFKDTSQF